MSEADDLYFEAVRYGLEIPEDLHRASPAERAAAWNGVGPERMPLVREMLTHLLGFLKAAAFIHDWRYYKALGIYEDWRSANAQMERNCYALIRRKLRWWQLWRKPGLVAATEGARLAVDSSEGRNAYDDAYKRRVEREFTPGPEVQG